MVRVYEVIPKGTKWNVDGTEFLARPRCETCAASEALLVQFATHGVQETATAQIKLLCDPHLLVFRERYVRMRACDLFNIIRPEPWGSEILQLGIEMYQEHLKQRI